MGIMYVHAVRCGAVPYSCAVPFGAVQALGLVVVPSPVVQGDGWRDREGSGVSVALPTSLTRTAYAVWWGDGVGTTRTAERWRCGSGSLLGAWAPTPAPCRSCSTVLRFCYASALRLPIPPQDSVAAGAAAGGAGWRRPGGLPGGQERAGGAASTARQPQQLLT